MKTELSNRRIWYGAQRYSSHFRTAHAYKRLLYQHNQLVSDVEQADIVILHYEPRDYHSLFREMPSLKKKYVIAYCVWESTELPESYQRSLRLVNEVWTCSHYCQKVIGAYHPLVTRIPHVIERDRTSQPLDREAVERMLGPRNEGEVRYLSIGRLWDKRKNILSLVKLFRSALDGVPSARLIVKCAPSDQPPRHDDPRITYITSELSHGELNALYEKCDIYLSAHHAEGWGLTLADAMLFGKPVIATGYSGNMDYMNRQNSFLLDYKERAIAEEDCYGLFDRTMRWAYPDLDQLRTLIETFHRGGQVDECKKFSIAAKKACEAFGADVIGRTLLERVEEIASSL